MTSRGASGTIVVMADEPTSKAQSKGPWAWLSNRAGLIILVVIATIVAVRLMSSWIKWLLIATVVGAVVYLVKGARRRLGSESKSE